MPCPLRHVELYPDANGPCETNTAIPHMGDFLSALHPSGIHYLRVTTSNGVNPCNHLR